MRDKLIKVFESNSRSYFHGFLIVRPEKVSRSVVDCLPPVLTNVEY